MRRGSYTNSTNWNEIWHDIVYCIRSNVFVAWFWAYFDASLFPDQIIGGIWPPKGIQTLDPWHIPLINTLILLLSGTTVTWAHHALLERNDERFKTRIDINGNTWTIFTMFQAYEYMVASFKITLEFMDLLFTWLLDFMGFMF